MDFKARTFFTLTFIPKTQTNGKMGQNKRDGGYCMVTPFSFGEDSTKIKKKKSNRQEESLAKKVGGKTQAGSGNQWHSKGDVQDKEFLHECKYTKNKSFRVSVDLWNEIDQKAFAMGGRIPALQLLLGEGQENLKLVVLSEDDYLALRGL